MLRAPLPAYGPGLRPPTPGEKFSKLPHIQRRDAVLFGYVCVRASAGTHVGGVPELSARWQLSTEWCPSRDNDFVAALTRSQAAQ